MNPLSPMLRGNLPPPSKETMEKWYDVMVINLKETPIRHMILMLQKNPSISESSSSTNHSTSISKNTFSLIRSDSNDYIHKLTYGGINRGRLVEVR